MVEKIYVCKYLNSESDNYLAMNHRDNSFLLVSKLNRALKGIDAFSASSNLDWMASDNKNSFSRDDFTIVEVTVTYMITDEDVEVK